MALLAFPVCAWASECVYLADENEGGLFVVDTQSRDVERISAGAHLEDVAVVGRYAYVVDAGPQLTFPYGPGSLVVVDLETKVPVRTVPLGIAPRDIAVADNLAYVTVAIDNVVTAIDLTTYDTSTFGNFVTPIRVALKPDGSALYVASQGGVDLVDTASLTVTRQVPVAEGVSAVGADNDLVLVGSNGIILAYDTTLQPRFTVDGTGIVSGIAIDGDVAFAATYLAGALLRVNLTPPYVVDIVDVDPRIRVEFSLLDVKLSADKRRAYVAGGGTLYIVNTTTLFVRRVDAAGFFVGMDVAPCVAALSASATPSATNTPTRTETAASTPTVTPTATPTASRLPSATPSATATPMRTKTHTPTSPATSTSTATPVVSPTPTRTETAPPASGGRSKGGCTMDTHRDSYGTLGLLIGLLPLLAVRRRAVLVCLLLAGAAAPLHADSLPDVFPGRVIVKFTDAVTQCAHCLLRVCEEIGCKAGVERGQMM